MTDASKNNKHLLLSIWIMVCGLLYIFIYQLKIPFKADLFLYGMVLGLAAMTFMEGRIVMNKQFLLFLLVDVSVVSGILYTTMFSQGLREAILFVFFSGLFVLSYTNTSFIKLFVKWIYLISVLLVISVIIQFLFPDSFNMIMQKIMRSDAYEQLIWSYTVDNAFAGLAAYTSNATFSAAIVFGHSFLSLADKKELPVINNKIINIVLLVLSLFSIILCSKRGIFIATIVSVIVLMFCLYKKNAFWLKFLSIATLFALALFILYQTNAFVTDFLDRFMTDDLLTGRDDIYDALLSDFKESNILIGRGTASTYAIAERGAHNIYLQVLYDHGLIFSIPYYVFLLYNYYRSFKSKCNISVFVQTLFLVYGLSGNPLYSNMFMMIYIYYVLYAARMPLLTRQNKDDTHS